MFILKLQLTGASRDQAQACTCKELSYLEDVEDAAYDFVCECITKVLHVIITKATNNSVEPAVPDCAVSLPAFPIPIATAWPDQGCGIDCTKA